MLKVSSVFCCFLMTGLFSSCVTSCNEDNGANAISEACRAFCEMRDECDYLDDMSPSAVTDCIQGCRSDVDYLRDEYNDCIVTYQSEISCTSDLSCSEYDEYMPQGEDEFPCKPESIAHDDCVGKYISSAPGKR